MPSGVLAAKLSKLLSIHGITNSVRFIVDGLPDRAEAFLMPFFLFQFDNLTARFRYLE